MAGEVILVVEDNEDELTIYTTLLTYHGYDVVAATDYDSGLAAAREHRPDLAIIDVNLGTGQKDGCELVAALQASPETRGIPVIAHTAFGDVYRRRLEAAGCRRIMHKPSDPMALIDSVRDVLAQGPEGETAQ